MTRTTPPARVDREALPDHAAERDERALPINEVGIRDLRTPITVWDKARSKQDTVATLSMSVGLPADVKGTHMSRFVEVLHDYRGELSLRTVPDLLACVQRRLDADEAFISAHFPYFLERRAPVSRAASLMDYDCRFEASRRGETMDFVLGVRVPVTTLCPCSKAVSRYGAHNQRGLVDVSLRFEGMIWIEDVVAAVERCASAPLYALLKREDEKYVTELAYDNPRFVEDLLREVVLSLRALSGESGTVRWLEVSAENLESIHNHSAWGRITWDADADTTDDGRDDGCAEAQSTSASAPTAPASFGGWLCAERGARRLSQRALAKAIGVSPSLLSRVEGGEKKLSPEALGRLAETLGLSADKLMLRAGVLPPAVLARIQADPEGLLAWAGC